MTKNEETAVRILNDIQLKVATAMNRAIEGNLAGAKSVLDFAGDDIERLGYFLAEGLTKE